LKAKEQRIKISSLAGALSYTSKLDEEELFETLKEYSGLAMNDIVKHYKEDIRKILALILWIDEKYSSSYGKPKLGIAQDPELEAPIFAIVAIPYCNKEEWKNIIREVKEEMKKNKLEGLDKKVTILCEKALAERNHKT